MTLEALPEELVMLIAEGLDFEDCLALSNTSARFRRTLRTRLRYFDKMQISDDPAECRLVDSLHRRPPMHFHPSNASQVLAATKHITELSILMKEIELTRALSGHERSPFTPGGYLAPLLFGNQETLLSLKHLTLHADLMVDSIKDRGIPCPFEDLSFAMQFLAHAQFPTFIQISACCTEYHDDDVQARNALIACMEQILKATAGMGAETEFVVEPADGYVDMTVKMKNLEYSFAFFYYNPAICEVAPPEELYMPMQCS